MLLNKAIIHDANPGCDPALILDQLRTVGLTASQLGIEVDVDVKRPRAKPVTTRPPATEQNAGEISLCGVSFPTSADKTVCAVSRDGNNRIPVENYLGMFRQFGFEGPFSLDLINRRAASPILKVLQRPSHSDLIERVMLQIPEIAVMYKSPWAYNSGQFNVEDEWRASWGRFCLNTRFPTLINEFITQGQDLNLFWEPVDLADYRRNLAEIIKNPCVKSIVYKLPHLTHSARFDPDRCMMNDLDFFNSVSRELVIIPLASVDLLKTVGRTLFSPEPKGLKSAVNPLHANERGPVESRTMSNGRLNGQSSCHSSCKNGSTSRH